MTIHLTGATTTTGPTNTTTTTSVACVDGGAECSSDGECCGNAAIGNCYLRNDGNEEVLPGATHPVAGEGPSRRRMRLCEPCWMVCGNGYQCGSNVTHTCPQDYTTVGPLMCCQDRATTTTTTTTTPCATTCAANLVQPSNKYTNAPGTGCTNFQHCAGLPNQITSSNVGSNCNVHVVYSGHFAKNEKVWKQYGKNMKPTFLKI
jgi:hypothetical protein